MRCTIKDKENAHYPAGASVPRPGAFYQQGTGRWVYPSGLSQNPPRHTGTGQSWHLMSQFRLEPHFGASAKRAHFYTLLPECICAPCGATARIADGSPLQAACIAPLRPRGTPLAPLCGYPPDVVTSLSPCWSCEAWSHAVRRVRLDAKRPVRGLGEPQQGASGNPKGYPDALLAYVNGMFSSLILHYGLEYSYTQIFDMATGNLNGFTVECEYNVDWSG